MPVRLLKALAVGLLGLAALSVGVAVFGGPVAGAGDPAALVSVALRVIMAAALSVASLLHGVLPSDPSLPTDDDSAACLLNTADCWINHGAWWSASLNEILAPAFTPGGFIITVLLVAVIGFLAGRLTARVR